MSTLLRIADNELTSNDVLLGRGAIVDRFPGNVAFRTLLRRYKSAYSNTSTVSAQKMELARTIVHIVHTKQGRFLRKIKADNHDNIPFSEIVDNVIAVEMVKQALRDVDTKVIASGRQAPTTLVGRSLLAEEPATLPMDIGSMAPRRLLAMTPLDSPRINIRGAQRELKRDHSLDRDDTIAIHHSSHPRARDPMGSSFRPEHEMTGLLEGAATRFPVDSSQYMGDLFYLRRRFYSVQYENV